MKLLLFQWLAFAIICIICFDKNLDRIMFTVACESFLIILISLTEIKKAINKEKEK